MTGPTKLDWALDVLSHVQKVYPEAFIAGGFLRDIELGTEPNDLDIFIPQKGNDQQYAYAQFTMRVAEINTKLQNANILVKNGRAKMAPFYDQLFVEDERPLIGVAMYEVEKVADQPAMGRYPIQIIALKEDGFSLTRTITDFDLGLCQIAHDGKALHKSPRFDDDLALKRMVITRSRSFPCFRRTVKRIDKLLERMPHTDSGALFEDSDSIIIEANEKPVNHAGWTVWTEVNIVTGKKLPQPIEWSMKSDDGSAA